MDYRATVVFSGEVHVGGILRDGPLVRPTPLGGGPTWPTEIHLGVRGIHVPHDPLHGAAVLHVRRGSGGLKAELIQHFEHRRIGDVAVRHKFSVSAFQKNMVEQRSENSHAFCTGAFRDIGQTQRHPFRISGPSIGVQHDGRLGVLPAGGRSAPP